MRVFVEAARVWKGGVLCVLCAKLEGQEHKRYGSMLFNRGTVGYGFAENARPYNRGNASNARPSAAAMAWVKTAVFTKTA